MAQINVKEVVNFAGLRLAAANSMGLFLEFTRAFNTYEVRCSEGKPSDKSAVQAIDCLRNLERATGEEIILMPVKNISDKEQVLDAIYEMSVRATRFTK